MGARWIDTEPAAVPHAVERTDTWLLVAFLLLLVVSLALGLA